MYIHMPNDTCVAKWGNSLAVRIPQAIVTKARLVEGDRLSFILAPDGSIVMRSGHPRYSLNQLVVAIRPGNRHRETDWKRKEVSPYSLRKAVAGSRRLARRTGG
jgi:antitoxin MazE